MHMYEKNYERLPHYYLIQKSLGLLKKYKNFQPTWKSTHAFTYVKQQHESLYLHLRLTIPKTSKFSSFTLISQHLMILVLSQ